MSDLKILRRPTVLKKIPVCRSTMYAMIAAGKFPAPIKLGPRSVGWVEQEVDDWLQEQIKARDQEVKSNA